MHPVVAKFRDRWPRGYGLVVLTVAFVLARLGRQIAAGHLAFSLLLLSAGYGVAGILYILLGATCNEWDRRFIASFNPSRMSWRETLAISGLGLGLLALTLLLRWAIR